MTMKKKIVPAALCTIGALMLAGCCCGDCGDCCGECEGEASSLRAPNYTAEEAAERLTIEHARHNADSLDS